MLATMLSISACGPSDSSFSGGPGGASCTLSVAVPAAVGTVPSDGSVAGEEALVAAAAAPYRTRLAARLATLAACSSAERFSGSRFLRQPGLLQRLFPK